jgi:general stress protein 26
MTGKAKICNDPYAREDAQYFCYFFDDFYEGADDPDFTLIELNFEAYELMKPGETHSVKVYG